MPVQYESRLLDIDYITTQIKSLDAIRKGLYGFTVRHSDNFCKGSNSIYVEFTHELSNGYIVKGNTLRISDHKARQWDGDEYLVNPKTVLTSKRKQNLIKSLGKTLNKSKLRIGNYCLKRFSTTDEK